MANLPGHLCAIVRFALATGCRMSEILHLEWLRVDFGRREVEGVHPKWCFAYEGRRMDAVGSAWKRGLRRAGIENFRFHDLRHTWASWHVMSGTRLQELMELGGWKSFEMVLRYAHLAPEHLANVAKRIEREWSVVEGNSTIGLRQDVTGF
jgi:integrase